MIYRVEYHARYRVAVTDPRRIHEWFIHIFSDTFADCGIARITATTHDESSIVMTITGSREIDAEDAATAGKTMHYVLINSGILFEYITCDTAELKETDTPCPSE